MERAAASAPQKIRAAVETVSDKYDRTCNVMILRQEESNEETLGDEVGKVSAEIARNQRLLSCWNQKTRQ